MVYEIPCRNCQHIYISKTGRPLTTRVKEHCKEVESIPEALTRAEKTTVASVTKKSAIMDHECNENHVTD